MRNFPARPPRTVQRLFIFLWAVCIVLFGSILRLDIAWIAFGLMLPPGLIGLYNVYRESPSAPVASAPAPVLEPVAEKQEAVLKQVSRELTRAAGSLVALSGQQSGVDEQAAVITRAARTLEDFNGLADRARREAVHLSVISRETTKITQSGQTALEQAIEGINMMQQQVNEIVLLLGSLAQHLRRITGINAAVSEIATQSNFLALNAAIEAARAGEQGRSFAMVADEVRILSEQARTAVGQVREILTQIHQAMEQTVNATELGAQSIETGVAKTNQAHIAIDKLGATLLESTSTVQKIIAAIDHQSASIEELVKSINSVGQVTLQSQAGLRLAENVAHDLTNLSDELNNLVGANGRGS